MTSQFPHRAENILSNQELLSVTKTKFPQLRTPEIEYLLLSVLGGYSTNGAAPHIGYTANTMQKYKDKIVAEVDPDVLIMNPADFIEYVYSDVDATFNG